MGRIRGSGIGGQTEPGPRRSRQGAEVAPGRAAKRVPWAGAVLLVLASVGMAAGFAPPPEAGFDEFGMSGLYRSVTIDDGAGDRIRWFVVRHDPAANTFGVAASSSRPEKSGFAPVDDIAYWMGGLTVEQHPEEGRIVAFTGTNGSAPTELELRFTAWGKAEGTFRVLEWGIPEGKIFGEAGYAWNTKAEYSTRWERVAPEASYAKAEPLSVQTTGPDLATLVLEGRNLPVSFGEVSGRDYPYAIRFLDERLKLRSASADDRGTRMSVTAWVDKQAPPGPHPMVVMGHLVPGALFLPPKDCGELAKLAAKWDHEATTLLAGGEAVKGLRARVATLRGQLARYAKHPPNPIEALEGMMPKPLPDRLVFLESIKLLGEMNKRDGGTLGFLAQSGVNELVEAVGTVAGLAGHVAGPSGPLSMIQSRLPQIVGAGTAPGVADKLSGLVSAVSNLLHETLVEKPIQYALSLCPSPPGLPGDPLQVDLSKIRRGSAGSRPAAMSPGKTIHEQLTVTPRAGGRPWLDRDLVALTPGSEVVRFTRPLGSVERSALASAAEACWSDLRAWRRQTDDACQSLSALELAADEVDRLVALRSLLGACRTEGHPGFVAAAAAPLAALDQLDRALEGLLSRTMGLARNADASRTQVHAALVECLVQQVKDGTDEAVQGWTNEVVAVQKEWETDLAAFRKAIEGRHALLDAFHEELADAAEDIELRAHQAASLLLRLADLDRAAGTPNLDALIQVIDYAQLGQLLHMLTKGVGWAAGKARRWLKPGDEAAARAAVEKMIGKLGKGDAQATAAWKIADQLQGMGADPKTLERIVDKFLDGRKSGKLDEIYGPANENAQAFAKHLAHLREAGVPAKDIDRMLDVLSQGRDHAARTMLDAIGGSLDKVAKKYGDVHVQPIGSGNQVAKYWRTKAPGKEGELPDPKVWTPVKNDFDLNLALPPETIQKVITQMQPEDVARELKNLGENQLLKKKDLLARNDDLTRMVAERQVARELGENFRQHPMPGAGGKTEPLGINPLAFDSMYFPANPVHSSREEVVERLIESLPWKSVNETAPQAGSDLAQTLNDALKRGRTEDVQDFLRKRFPGAAQDIDRMLRQAKQAPSMREASTSLKSLLRVAEVTGDGAFVAKGSRKFVGKMLRGEFSKAGGTFEKVSAEAEKSLTHLRGRTTFAVEDGVDIIQEMRAFAMQNRGFGKSADKVAKYPARGAFGAMALDPAVAKRLDGLWDDLAKVHPKADPEELVLQVVAKLANEPGGKLPLPPREALELAGFLKAKKAGFASGEAGEEAARRFGKLADDLGRAYGKELGADGAKAFGFLKENLADAKALYRHPSAKQLGWADDASAWKAMDSTMDAWWKRAVDAEKGLGLPEIERRARQQARDLTLSRMSRDQLQALGIPKETIERIEKVRKNSHPEVQQVLGADGEALGRAQDAVGNAGGALPDSPLWKRAAGYVLGSDPVQGAMLFADKLFGDLGDDGTADLRGVGRSVAEEVGNWADYPSQIAYLTSRCALNPAGTLARIAKLLAKLYYLDSGAYERVGSELTARIHGLISRLRADPHTWIHRLQQRDPLDGWEDLRADRLELAVGARGDGPRLPPLRVSERLQIAARSESTGAALAAGDQATVRKARAVRLEEMHKAHLAWLVRARESLATLDSELAALATRKATAAEIRQSWHHGVRCQDALLLAGRLETLHRQITETLRDQSSAFVSSGLATVPLAGVWGWAHAVAEEIRQGKWTRNDGTSK